MMDELAHFVKIEKECCSFFDFTIQVKGDTIDLKLEGPEGAKAFIVDEMELINS